MRKRPVLDRIAEKIDFFGEDGCWVWLAAKTWEGYGQVKHKGQMRLAHRVAYQVTVEEIPDGLVCDHLCRNTSCVNPDHIEIVTNQENTKRGDYTNRRRKMLASTHCCRGHEWSEKNTYVDARGYKICRPCGTENKRRSRLARRG